jgi:hypothetical protein
MVRGIVATTSQPSIPNPSSSLMSNDPSLGHTTIATTADIYGHLTPTMLDRAAERMDAILTG